MNKREFKFLRKQDEVIIIVKWEDQTCGCGKTTWDSANDPVGRIKNDGTVVASRCPDCDAPALYEESPSMTAAIPTTPRAHGRIRPLE